MNFCYNCMRQLPDQQLNTCPYCKEPLVSSAASPDVLPPGTVLQGKFIIGKLLGSGGFGNTYIGWNQVLSCRVAIKEFFPRHLSMRNADRKTICISSATIKSKYEQSLRSFLEEARNLAELGNVAGIPDIYGYFQENGTGYIVMEYLEGITVKQLLKDSGGKLSYEWSRQIILSVLYTLKEIHRRGILHRDIAPDNIMITSEGIIKLIDFGVAKKQMSDVSDPVIMLKKGYSPPEQYTRNNPQGVYTDLYSVAATFYHMITGIKPPGALERAGQETLQPPSACGIKISKSAEMAIMMCLHLRPEHRLGSAEEFMTALHGADFKPTAEPVQSPDSKEAKKADKKTWEFPLAGKIASVVLLAAVAVAGVILVTGQRSVTESSHNEAVLASSVIGMSESEANKQLADSGLAFEVNDVTFDRNVENGSEILTQEPAAGEEVSDGKITGAVRSSEKCRYGDLLSEQDNVEVLVAAFGIDESRLTASTEQDAEDKKKEFKNLYAVILQDGTVLRPEDLEREKDTGILNLSEIQSVTYYITPYLYQKKLDNYVGKNIQDVSFGSYSERNGKIVKVKMETPPHGSTYYSFTKKEGYIVKQLIKPGKSWHSSKMKGELFDTVKERIHYEGKKAGDLIQELKEKGFEVKEKGSGSQIESVTVDGKGGKTYFTLGDMIIVTRKEKAVPKPTKKPEEKTKHVPDRIQKEGSLHSDDIPFWVW